MSSVEVPPCTALRPLFIFLSYRLSTRLALFSRLGTSGHPTATFSLLLVHLLTRTVNVTGIVTSFAVGSILRTWNSGS